MKAALVVPSVKINVGISSNRCLRGGNIKAGTFSAIPRYTNRCDRTKHFGDSSRLLKRSVIASRESFVKTGFFLKNQTSASRTRVQYKFVSIHEYFGDDF